MIIVSILCIGCISEQIVFNLPSFDLESVTKDVTQIQNLIKHDCEVAYVTLSPKSRQKWRTNLIAMWAGLKANIPIVNGYSGNVPPNYGTLDTSMNLSQVINWLGEDSRKRLCIISQSSIKEKDNILSKYALPNSDSLGAWTSYKINLPIPKVFAQEIRGYEISKNLVRGSEIELAVIVKNTSNFLWSHNGHTPTNFSYRWIDINGKLTHLEGDRTPLPFDLSPGDSVALNALIKTPIEPGEYSLVLTMVQESVAWFSDKQAYSPKIDITVTSNF